MSGKVHWTQRGEHSMALFAKSDLGYLTLQLLAAFFSLFCPAIMVGERYLHSFWSGNLDHGLRRCYTVMLLHVIYLMDRRVRLTSSM